jgi:hypothetical protein
VQVSCVEAVRYRGSDRNILAELYQRGAYSSCDASPSVHEQLVIEYVKEVYPAAKANGVHWTFVCEDLPNSSIIACCYGPYPHVLRIFELERSTRSITLRMNDKKYRPRFDNFMRTERSTIPASIFRWWPFARNKDA